jgi:transposase-like protein
LGRLDVHRAVTARAHPRELAGEAVVVAAFVAAHETFYTAVDEQAAGTALEAVADRWQTRYPAIVNLWRAHWAEFVPFLAFPPEIRRVIYTTNLIESINARLRKVTRNPGQFPSEQAALKVLYLAVRNLEEYLRPNVGTRSSGWKQAIQAFTSTSRDASPHHDHLHRPPDTPKRSPCGW